MPLPAQLPSSPLLQALAAKNQTAQAEFKKRHTFASKWLAQKGLTLGQIREHSAKLLTGATLGGALLLSSPHVAALSSGTAHVATQRLEDFLAYLQNYSQGGSNLETEKQIETNIDQFYGLSTAFVLDQQRLPDYMGDMGLEQHLLRFPGDSLSTHDAYQEAGVAPGLGAFGYFSEVGKSVSQMETEERYYIVLQTFILPEWSANWGKLKDWFKFRKFLVINPQTGEAVVAVLGDSGPATSTGKQFGGSPEVMAALGFYPRQTRGHVFVLFLDDPGNSIPLGPVKQKGA